MVPQIPPGPTTMEDNNIPTKTMGPPTVVIHNMEMITTTNTIIYHEVGTLSANGTLETEYTEVVTASITADVTAVDAADTGARKTPRTLS